MKYRDCLTFFRERIQSAWRAASWPTRIVVLILVPVVIIAVSCGIASCVGFHP